MEILLHDQFGNFDTFLARSGPAFRDMVDMVLDKENARIESNVTIFPDPKMPTLEKNIASRDHHGLHAQTEEEKRREADLLKNLVGPDLEKMQKGKK